MRAGWCKWAFKCPKKVDFLQDILTQRCDFQLIYALNEFSLPADRAARRRVTRSGGIHSYSRRPLGTIVLGNSIARHRSSGVRPCLVQPRSGCARMPVDVASNRGLAD